MTEPLRSRYVPGYDLFKLIVAVILTIILILLLLRENPPPVPMPVTPSQNPTLANTPTSPTTNPVTGTPEPVIATTNAPPPTSTNTPTPTATQPTKPPPTESPIPVPSPVTPTPEPSPLPDPNACPSNPTQIKVGDRVETRDWLNFRIGPGLNYPIQHTNKPKTEMDVIGGPVCTPRGENPPRAHLWWNVRMGNGKEGWSAEAPMNFPNYFMEPIR